MNRPATMIDPGTIKLERVLPGPIERVWSYITESEKRAKWLAAGPMDLRVGGKVRLEFDNEKLPNDEIPDAVRQRGKGTFEGVIPRLEPPRLLAHTWEFKGSDTEVSYELTPRGKDVVLVIVHRNLGRDLRAGVMGGWDTHTGILSDILNGVKPRPFWSTHAKLEREYEDAKISAD